MRDEVEIASRDYWVKVVDFLQQNWALADSDSLGRTIVFFVNDGSGVFDQLLFDSSEEAVAALQRNGFKRFQDAANLRAFLAPPPPPFKVREHPNGKIYSLGRFWR